jgi:hypothetical protein
MVNSYILGDFIPSFMFVWFGNDFPVGTIDDVLKYIHMIKFLNILNFKFKSPIFLRISSFDAVLVSLADLVILLFLTMVIASPSRVFYSN